MAILMLLAEAPHNGYQLMQEIEQRSEGTWRPSPGSMYPALQLLEDEGLVRVEANAGSRTFQLTAKGVEQAKAQPQEPAPWTTAAAGTGETVGELREIFHQVALAAMQVAQAGTQSQVVQARKILAEARRALYLILANDDPTEDKWENA